MNHLPQSRHLGTETTISFRVIPMPNVGLELTTSRDQELHDLPTEPARLAGLDTLYFHLVEWEIAA